MLSLRVTLARDVLINGETTKGGNYCADVWTITTIIYSLQRYFNAWKFINPGQETIVFTNRKLCQKYRFMLNIQVRTGLIGHFIVS